ncbi:NADH dehydrogenase subunit 2 (mitochondrion) [Diadema setosum]|uniref:NADH-ubiquinone oxidoreductase chain 2 n=1 Tax=Diadema setosum TaxID=31175 RepID=A0A343AW54_DIASE|nr:NADH dehydrogenase subunit 2 [Diadema setosum]APT41346.1 NADH dehydrogenase subunit 2 [Diadema setosum]
MHRLTSTFLFLTVILGTAIVASSENWFIIWVGLELSTLAIIPILCSGFTPRSVEASIKYFLVQALSAALLLNSALVQAWLTGSWSTSIPLNLTSQISLSIALAFKIGLAPCHFWFPDVLQGLPLVQGLLISTWQKIAPLIILFSFSNLVFSKIVIALGLFSVLVGGWGGLNQTQMRKILAFSSIAHMGWISLTSVYYSEAAFVMLALYLIINTAIFLTANFLGVLTLGHLNVISQLSPLSTVILVLIVLSLGGLPPLTGFMVKFISLYHLVSNNFLIFSVLLIIGSLLSLFFYLRITFNVALILFPHHILALSSWRNCSPDSSLSVNTWLVSTLFIVSTATIPLSLSLYMIL